MTESCELCIDKPLFPIGPFFLVPAYGSVGGSVGKDSEMWQCDFVKETYHRGWALRFQRPIPGPVSFACCLWIRMYSSQLLPHHHSSLLPVWRS